tara:strand:+ start:990 stop:1364 length:375 start_codon:yes stop_codon:yes gene_type:complete
MAGKIVADTLEHSTAGSVDTQYVVDGSAKAWLYYKQNTPEVADSLNTSSVTDTATGNYLQNYTNSFDASYDGRAMGGTGFATDKFLSHGSTGSTTGAQQFNLYDISGSGLDDSFSSALTHGNLA